jgi:hypothetical protein
MVEFSYHNGYQESLKMSPFEVLYGRTCRFQVSGDSPMDTVTLGTKFLKEMEQEMIKIRKNMKVTQDRQKRYVESERTPKEFKVGDHVYIQVKPNRSSLRMGVCAKLETQYCGPFEVLERIGPIAYRLALSPTFKAHNVFHVYFLKNYVHVPNHVIDWTVI